MRCAIPVRDLKRVSHMASVRQGDAFIGDGGASNLAELPFELGPFVRARPCAHVEREASRFGQRVVRLWLSAWELVFVW